MKNYTLLLFVFLAAGQFNWVSAQSYPGCPHTGASGSAVGLVGWRIKDPSTDAVITTSPQPSTLYKLEIFYTGSAGSYYSNLGIQGVADGFKLYSSVSLAQNSPNSYFSDSDIQLGVGRDGSGPAVFGIVTLDASDPNWSGQLTAFKAYGLCYDTSLPNKYYKKTLTILP